MTSARVGGQWDQLVALDDAGRLWHGNYVADMPSYWSWRLMNLPEQPPPERRH